MYISAVFYSTLIRPVVHTNWLDNIPQDFSSVYGIIFSSSRYARRGKRPHNTELRTLRHT